MAIQLAIPKNKTGIEIGFGTGRFAAPLNIKFGVGPSENSTSLAARLLTQSDFANFEYLLTSTKPNENEIKKAIADYGQYIFIVNYSIK